MAQRDAVLAQTGISLFFLISKKLMGPEVWEAETGLWGDGNETELRGVKRKYGVKKEGKEALLNTARLIDIHVYINIF